MPIIVNKADLTAPLTINRPPDRLYTPKGQHPLEKAVTADSTDALKIDSKGSPLNANGSDHPTLQGPKDQSILGQPDAKEEQDPRLQELARQEAALQVQREALKAEKAQLEAQRSAPPAPQGMTAEQWKAKFMSEGPESLGIGYQEMADKYLAQPSDSEKVVNELRQELAKIREEQASSRQAIEAAQQQAYDRAVKQLDKDVRSMVERSPQDYELISAESAHEQVVNLIKDTYARDGIFMSVQEAAGKVENDLLEKALKYAALTKVRARTQIVSAPQDEKTLVSFEAKTPQQGSARSAGPSTLTRQMEQASKPLSAAERREKAIAAFHKKL